MEKYRVYVGAIQNLSEKTKYSCCDPSMARMLVYAQVKPLGDFRILKKNEKETLSDIEKRWLNKTRICIALANTGDTAKNIAQSMNELMDALEEELKREKEAMDDGEYNQSTKTE